MPVDKAGQLIGSESRLQHGRLSVDRHAGAGIQLLHCEVGMLVEEVELDPGQPYLSVGDVIVAISGILLCDLDAEEAEQQFGAGFRNGAAIVFGTHSTLTLWPMSVLLDEAERLLDMHAADEDSENQRRGSFEANNSAARTHVLSATDADKGVKVSECGTSVSCVHTFDKNWRGVRGQIGILTGAYQYEVELSSACLLRAGWSAPNSRRVLGKDAKSFGYGGTAMKSFDGKFEPYGEQFDQSCGADHLPC